MPRTRPDMIGKTPANATHLMSHSSTYNIWRSMLARCDNPKRKDYFRYGGAGITVCERWRKFENFLADMGVRPSGLTLDRRDGTLGYTPDNCRWATPSEQARNRRGNVLVTHAGITATVAEWAERSGLERKTIEYRVRVGWDHSKAVTTPSITNRKNRNVQPGKHL